MAKLSIAWTKTAHSVTVSFEGETHTICSDAKEFGPLVDALRSGAHDTIPGIIAGAKAAINRYGAGKIALLYGELCLDTPNGWRALPMQLADRILSHEAEGLPIGPLCAFAANLLSNPSRRSVTQLFAFLEKNAHPITEDGCFIAYRGTDANYRDKYSGTYDNSVGQTCSMPRNGVDDDPTRTCSTGLHVANFAYAKDWSNGGHLLQVKVNPRDVVAVPVDYDGAKMRVCEFYVMSEIDRPATCLQWDETDDTDETDDDQS